MFGKLIKLLFDKEQMKEPLDMSEKKEQSAKAPTVHESLIPSFGKELAQQVTAALTIWATLSLFGVIKLPFIERTKLIAVCYWLLIILHNLCLYLWAAHRGITRNVRKDNTVHYMSNRYSVPPGTYNRMELVHLHIVAGCLKVCDPATGEIIQEHTVSDEKGKLIKDRGHARERSRSLDSLR